MENHTVELNDTPSPSVTVNPLKRQRLDDDLDGNVRDTAIATTLLPYHDVRLARQTHAHLRIFILPNAWVCVRIYTHDSHLFKDSTFSFPRIDRYLHDSSVPYELGEWSGAKKYSYDMISIALVLADLEGNEKRLRVLKEIDIEDRVERVLKCLKIINE